MNADLTSGIAKEFEAGYNVQGDLPPFSARPFVAFPDRTNLGHSEKSLVAPGFKPGLTSSN
ncbi:hypothetical protein [Metapseudomonas otitidis]|uniref:hypothetical protein n=1 Tax=Metapseudomonas otitidis TaxID=319939 RepID=UPI0013F5AF04|nr:hypothetical protein [Pseudomonas otitidis]